MNTQKKRFVPAFNATRISNLRCVSGNLALAADSTLPIEQQLADAFNANNTVMAYVVGITNSTLHTIPNPPSWYTEFETAFSNAQIHANDWFSIATNLVSIPNSISGYGIAFNASMNTINSLLTVLKEDPTNAAAISALQSQLKGMISQIRSYSQTAVTFQQSITNFANNLTADAKILSDAVTNSLTTQSVDQAQIKQFQDDINALQSKISTWQAVETAAAIAAGVGFFTGAVIAIFSFGIGLAFGVVCAVAGVTLMIVAAEEIKALNNQVDADTAQMNAVTQQVACLVALNNQLNTLITLSKAASDQIALVLQVWNELETEINTVLTDLNSCNGDTTPLNLPQLQTDLNIANQDWQTLVGLCNIIASIKFNQATPATANL